MLGPSVFITAPLALARASCLKLTVLFQVCCPESHYRTGRLVNGAPIYPTNTDIDNYFEFAMNTM
eukprot:6621702-Ditylum_brightwellii.AAC.1